MESRFLNKIASIRNKYSEEAVSELEMCKIKNLSKQLMYF